MQKPPRTQEKFVLGMWVAFGVTFALGLVWLGLQVAQSRERVQSGANPPTAAASASTPIADLRAALGKTPAEIERIWGAPAQRREGETPEMNYRMSGVGIDFMFRNRSDPVVWAFVTNADPSRHRTGMELIRSVNGEGLEMRRREWAPGAAAEGQRYSDVAGVWLGLPGHGEPPKR